MKILQIITRAQLRGAEIFACQLSVELKSQGHHVDVVFLYGDQPSEWPFKSLNMIPLNANREKRFFDLKAYKRLYQIINDGAYDLVQANASDTIKYATMTKWLFRYTNPVIYRNASTIGDFFKSRLQRLYNTWLLNKCDYYISVSEQCRLDLISITPRARSRAVTITIGTYLFDTVPASHRIDEEPVFVNIGSFVEEKNQLFLLEIFHQFFIKHKKGRLWIVGDGRLRKVIEEKISRLEIGERVKLWGYRTDVISILKSSDVMLMPSAIEGIPAVLMEAMVCRVPVVASNVGGIPEIVHNGISGFCITSAKAEDYLTAMETLAFDREKREEIVANARLQIEDQYLMSNIASRFASQYRFIVSEK